MYLKKVSQADKVEKSIFDVYTKQKMALEAVDMQRLTPQAITKNILIPRQKMYQTVIVTWLQNVFLPSLSPRLAEQVLMYGVGRIFSLYNDTGVQHCTDADLNIVVPSTLKASEIKELNIAVEEFRKKMLDMFGLIVEVNPDFTVRTDQDIQKKLLSEKSKERIEAMLFYKCNEPTLWIIKDNPILRKAIFAKTRKLPDSLFFIQFLADNPTKPTLLKIRADQTRLPIIADDTLEKEEVGEVIGSRKFTLQARELSRINPDLYPPEWYFSMKYFVNRVYDYVSSLRCQGYSLTDIGFDNDSDPDYLFICNAHALALYSQELIHDKLDTFNVLSDASYMSSSRFIRFVQVAGKRFLENFEEMVIKGKILYQSEQKQYFHLKECVIQNNRERIIKRPRVGLPLFLERHGYDKNFHKVDEDSNDMIVCIPYTWADVGYFVYNSIANRMISVTGVKLVKALKKLGLPQKEIDLYQRMLLA